MAADKKPKETTSTGGLNTPGRTISFLPRVQMDQDAFGRFAEAFARFMGTPGFILWMTLAIVAWLVWNTVAPDPLRIDPFPYIFLTLILSLQASYASPLILLATNRQEARDRISSDQDRRTAAQSRADMDYLAREIAALRMTVGDMATREFIRAELRNELREVLDEMADDRAEDESEESGAGKKDRKSKKSKKDKSRSEPAPSPEPSAEISESSPTERDPGTPTAE